MSQELKLSQLFAAVDNIVEDHQLYCFVAKMKQATVRDMHIWSKCVLHGKYSGKTAPTYRIVRVYFPCLQDNISHAVYPIHRRAVV